MNERDEIGWDEMGWDRWDGMGWIEERVAEENRREREREGE